MQMDAMNRKTLSICVAVVLLVGCAGTLTPSGPSGVNALTHDAASARPADGGEFVGTYNGSAKVTTCDTTQPGRFTFKAESGKASFLGESRDSGAMAAVEVKGKCDWIGVGELISTNNKDGIGVQLDLSQDGRSPCDGHKFSWVVFTGVGKFRGARGGGFVTFHCSGSKGYSDEWTGTLYF
jgi:hypothetical protein